MFQKGSKMMRQCVLSSANKKAPVVMTGAPRSSLTIDNSNAYYQGRSGAEGIRTPNPRVANTDALPLSYGSTLLSATGGDSHLSHFYF